MEVCTAGRVDPTWMFAVTRSELRSRIRYSTRSPLSTARFTVSPVRPASCLSLGVAMASLFDAPAANAKNSPVARRDDQPQWQDAASGYLRRIVSPAGIPQPMQIVEVHFPPGRRVAFKASRRDSHIYQQVWVLEGEIEITSDGECYRLCAGDCLAMQLGRPKVFYNPTNKLTRYAVVVASETTLKR